MQIFKDGRIAHYREMFPNISFPASGPSDDFLAERGAYKVSVFRDHDRATQKLVSCNPYVEGGWAYTVKVEPKTAEEIDADKLSLSAKVRADRDSRLSKTDWTQLDDSPITNAKKLEWATYRQSLRDIPLQAGFPENVTWPKEP